MGFHRHLKWSLLCVWFSPTVNAEAFLFAQIAVIGSWKKCCEKLQFSQLFGQLIVGSIEKCFVCFLFSMPTVTALFIPRSDLGYALAL